MLHSLAGVFGVALDLIETYIAWLADRAGWLESQQGVWVVVGAILGFAGGSLLQSIQKRRQRQLARMQVATNLRHWMNRVLGRVYNTINWADSDGQVGIANTEIPDFRFESALEQVALLDRKMAKRIFDLVHRKDDLNSEAEAANAYHQSDDDEAINAFRGGAAALWLDALDMYREISSRIGWKERVFSDDASTGMQSEVERLRTIEQNRASSARQMHEFFRDTKLKAN
jgi:hypothetical protein